MIIVCDFEDSQMTTSDLKIEDNVIDYWLLVKFFDRTFLHFYILHRNVLCIIWQIFYWTHRVRIEQKIHTFMMICFCKVKITLKNVKVISDFLLLIKVQSEMEILWRNLSSYTSITKNPYMMNRVQKWFIYRTWIKIEFSELQL